MYLFCYIFKTPPVDLDFVSLQLFAHNVTQKLEIKKLGREKKTQLLHRRHFLLIFNKKN
jgi:hypothetical protein